MGRTSKFTFPVPGRKPKPPPVASISAPLTKAQKILGTGEINVDSPTLPRDPSRAWETSSNSGMSVTISESTASYASDTGLGILNEDKVVNGVTMGRPWEEESEIIPSRNRIHAIPGDIATDASSLRRQHSGSTIYSYYDKSKLPLSISQQTSSSAIAKGLPRKADVLLDIGGVASESARGQKKKPAMLDLSHLLPKSRRKQQVELQKGLVLGPDLVTKSPSQMSMSPEIAPPPISQRVDRKLRKKNTKESIGSSTLTPRPDLLSPPLSGFGVLRGQSSGADLNNLYEHYEQRMFQDMVDEGELEDQTPGMSLDAFPTPPPSSSTRGFLSPYSAPAARTPFSLKSSPMSNTGGAETPAPALLSPKSLTSTSADCSTSISSRHTRTSKASKRTDRSMTDFDPQQNSVLSLSSDSEEEFPEPRPTTSVSAPGNTPRFVNEPIRPASPNDEEHVPRPSATNARRGKPGPKRASFAPNNQYIPDNNSSVNPVKPPAINTRTSSLSLNSTSTGAKTVTPSDRSTSRLSTRSNSTTTSVVRFYQSAEGHLMPTVQDAKAISMVPALLSKTTYSPRRATSRQSRSSEQPTPPLSPTSMDFYLQSQHTSVVDPDIGSIRSGMSLPTINETSRLASPSAARSRASTSSGDGRFMAVTRQEEMLLAALRVKRARMRETIIAEFEEEQEQAFENILDHGRSSPTDGSAESAAPSIRNGSTGVVPNPHSRHGSSTSTITNGFRKPAGIVLRPSKDSQVEEDEQSQWQPQLEQHRWQRPSLTVTSTNRHIKAPAAARLESIAEPVPRYNRTHLRLTRSPDPPPPFDAPEPSPDLSDFMVFDDGSEDHFPPHTPSTDGFGRRGSGDSATTGAVGDYGPRVGANTARTRAPPALAAVGGRFLEPKRAGGAYHHSEPASPLAGVGGGRRGDVHVRIVEDGLVGSGEDGVMDGEEGDESDPGAGIPRPDSPISSVVPVLPKKKAARLSAVGRVGVESGWWGHDG